jgi:cytochrome P450
VHLASPDAVKKVFQADRSNRMNPGRSFLLEPLLGRRSILLQVGDEHLRRRRMLLPPFHGERMRSYEQVIVDATRATVARWPRGRAFPLLGEMQAITLDVILRAVFGLRPGPRADEIRDVLTRTLEEANHIGPQLTLALVGERVRALHPVGRRIAQGQRLIGEEIAERRGASDLAEREDILSLLLMARDEDGEPLGDEELRDQLVTLLVAGHETTATGLAWTFDALFRTPHALARLRDELDGGDGAYLAAVVDEALRVRPVIPEVGRRLGEAVEVDGHRLEEGTDVLCSVHLMHRRAALFEDPLAFRPGAVPGRAGLDLRVGAVRRRDAPLPRRGVRAARDAGRAPGGPPRRGPAAGDRRRRADRPAPGDAGAGKRNSRGSALTPCRSASRRTSRALVRECAPMPSRGSPGSPRKRATPAPPSGAPRVSRGIHGEGEAEPGEVRALHVSHVDHLIAGVAERQQNLISIAQMKALGVSPDQWEWRVRVAACTASIAGCSPSDRPCCHRSVANAPLCSPSRTRSHARERRRRLRLPASAPRPHSPSAGHDEPTRSQGHQGALD